MVTVDQIIKSMKIQNHSEDREGIYVFNCQNQPRLLLQCVRYQTRRQRRVLRSSVLLREPSTLSIQPNPTPTNHHTSPFLSVLAPNRPRRSSGCPGAAAGCSAPPPHGRAPTPALGADLKRKRGRLERKTLRCAPKHEGKWQGQLAMSYD